LSEEWSNVLVSTQINGVWTPLGNYLTKIG
jgi:hypothetical protein